MADETIGDWTVDRLVRFMQNALEENPPSRIPTLVCDEVIVNTKFTIGDQVLFSQAQTTVGAAGSASALPANPTGYIRILDYTGAPFVIPYYRAS